MTTFLPELTSRGLVLWQVHRDDVRSLTCWVQGYGRDLVLSVYDTATSRVVGAEAHTDIGSLVEGAEQIQKALLASGWQDADASTEGRLRGTRR